ncbi:Phosphate regulon transcriptional regulatory protein PhoB (SphR) [hydrothermal vent metagenome]|uniref:Phosphate regulon transcriptional regulatory protein PhoB (SphR) n=1 Tax=hydrothermal vent metagenome TaxID=652676 RepID=A0A3B0URY0_9ZZZZ
MDQTILIVEDETRIAHWVQSYFEQAGFKTLVTADGAEGLQLALTKQPDLVILDWMLPGMDGLEVCKRIRRESSVPIIMLTAKGKEIDRILGLELGADDYVVKPFSPDELVARARAVLRRMVLASASEDEEKAKGILRAGEVELDTAAFLCKIAGQEVALSRIQFALLETFMRHTGQALTRQQLLDAAFKGDYEGFERTIDVHIRRLRRRIEADPSNPQYIVTVFGIGYKFAAQG